MPALDCGPRAGPPVIALLCDDEFQALGLAVDDQVCPERPVVIGIGQGNVARDNTETVGPLSGVAVGAARVVAPRRRLERDRDVAVRNGDGCRSMSGSAGRNRRTDNDNDNDNESSESVHESNSPIRVTQLTSEKLAEKQDP